MSLCYSPLLQLFYPVAVVSWFFSLSNLTSFFLVMSPDISYVPLLLTSAAVILSCCRSFMAFSLSCLTSFFLVMSPVMILGFFSRFLIGVLTSSSETHK